MSNYGGQHGTTISVFDLQTRTKVKDITQVVKMDFTTGQTLGSVAVAPVGDGLALAMELRQPQKKRRAVRS